MNSLPISHEVISFIANPNEASSTGAPQDPPSSGRGDFGESRDPRLTEYGFQEGGHALVEIGSGIACFIAAAPFASAAKDSLNTVVDIVA